MTERPIAFSEEYNRRESVLTTVAENLQPIINSLGIDLAEGRLLLDPNPFAIHSATHFASPQVSYTEGRHFLFSGHLYINTSENAFYLDEVGVQAMASIDHILIPEPLRKKGLGRRIVTAWEDAWRALGVEAFMAHNVAIGEREAIFRRLGYKRIHEIIPNAPTRKWNRNMYKLHPRPTS